MKIKKIVSLVLAFTMLLSLFSLLQGFAEQEPGMNCNKKTNEISLRDPCVILHEGKYYMYGTGAATGGGIYGCYVSEDLENWAGPFNVCTPPAGFDGVKDFWAPECHYYNGNFYLFATYYSSAANHRGVSVFQAESPLGPFVEISEGHITPKDWDAIDGTLYVDRSGQPWMVFVHEWTSMPDGKGDFSAAKLSDDLSAFISEPIALFKSTEMPTKNNNSVTDGCWLYTTKSGELLMLWSGSGRNGYSVAVARSVNGRIDGKWVQDPFLLYEKCGVNPYDGGHGMLFETKEGKRMMSIHSPNNADVARTTPVFLEVNDLGHTLELKQAAEKENVPLYYAKKLITWIFSWINNLFGDWFCGQNRDNVKPLTAGVKLAEYIAPERETVQDADFYVSAADGSDANPGTKAAPFASLAKAQQAARAEIAAMGAQKRNLTVAVFGGEYTGADNRITFDENDFIGEGYELKFTAYDNEAVTVTGAATLNPADFEALTDAEKARLSPAAASKVLAVDLARYGITKANYGKLYSIGAYSTAYKYDGDHTGVLPGEFFYNDKRQTLASYPNNGQYLGIEKVLDVGDCYESSPQNYDETWAGRRNHRGGTFTVDAATNERMKRWQTMEDVWMFGYFYWDWADSSTTLAAYDPNAASVTTTYVSNYGCRADALYSFYNVFEELDIRGEYYIDREANKLYFYPPADFAGSKLSLNIYQGALLRFASGARNVTVAGLDFSGTRGTAVEVLGENCKLTGAKVSNAAEDGAIVKGKNNLLSGCEIYAIGKNAVSLGSNMNVGGADIRANGLVMENNTVKNNNLHDYAEIQKTYASGISLHGVGNVAANNEIYNAPHMGIFYEGNEHLIENNYLHHVVRHSSDAGAIYAGRNLSFYGNVLRCNVISDIGGDGFTPSGIYFDDGLAGQTAYGNVLVNIPGNAFLIGSGRDVEVYNNLIVNAGKAIYYDDRTYDGYHNDGWYRHYVKEPTGTHWALLENAKTLNAAWGHKYPGIDTMLGYYANNKDANYAINPNGHVYNNIILAHDKNIGMLSKGVQKYATVENNQIFSLKDIGFTDFAAGDYSFKDNAQFSGFAPIPFAEIGRK